VRSRATAILAGSLTLLAALTGATACSAAQGSAASGCGQYWRSAAGSFVIENNNYLGKPECLVRTGSQGFRVTRSGAAGPPGSGKPAAYPEIFTGYHWGTQAGTAFPARLSSLSHARSSWAVSTNRAPADSAYNVAYDLWVNKGEQVAASGQPDGAEVMIWLSERAVPPPAPDTPTVTVHGVRYYRIEIARSEHGVSWPLIIYRRVVPVTSVRDLELLSFVADAAAQHQLSMSWYLESVEAGFEIWRGGTGLASRSFAVSAG
jgi:Glycosyl hydrolase family 12